MCESNPTRPERPYQQYMTDMVQRTERAIAMADPVSSSHAGAPADLTSAVTATAEGLADQLISLSHDIHANPELGFEEFYAVERVAKLVSSLGYEVETGAYGVETALRARAGQGRPRVAIIAEYDALPGIGHACGHNVICATAVGAFLAVAEHVADLDGSVELIGSPAEEGGGGKELIARAGGFDEIDCAIMLHPFGADAAVHPWLSVRKVGVTYHGLASHAAAMPHLGRNALDALVLAYTGMSQLRQHFLPGDRVHGVITDGGQRPNIVPERAQGMFYLRSPELTGIQELSARAKDIFEGAAQVTGTHVEIDWDTTDMYLPVRTNHALAARYATNLTPRGRKVLPEGVLPAEMTGSTDMGNVSVRVPSIHPLLSVAPPNVAIHTTEFAKFAGSERGDAGVLDGAIGLALTAVDYLTDAQLRADVAAEFEQAGGVVDVEAVTQI